MRTRTHGISAYRVGCRCDVCRAAKSKYAKEKRDPKLERERVRKWQEENRERYLASSRAYSSANSARNVARAIQWAKANPDRVKINSLEHAHRRRARMLEGDIVSCNKIISDWRKDKSFVCAYCSNTFDISKLSIDHIVPLSRGGGHVPSNLAKSCYPCNKKKGAKLLF